MRGTLALRLSSRRCVRHTRQRKQREHYRPYNGRMDLLDRINALTDDQLRMVAERDDASGVLAAYRLAELRGLPYPDREAAILGDGYVIVAQAGQIQKLPIESVSKVIREESGEYCVYSHDGSRSFGCYPTMEDAERRLRQIHVFRAVSREGSFVSWNSSGGRARGQVEHVMREGVLGVPGSEFSINATEDDPAVLIRIWRQGSQGWAATETLVGHKMSTLTPITPLNKQATKREDGEDFPPEAFAYTPDREMPSTWKLRLWDSLEERETAAQVGRALAALGPGGFRGNRVQIPAEDLPSVRRKVLAAWRKVNEPDAEIPEVLKQTFTPPEGVQEAAQRALDWIAEGHAGSGFTDTGRARAAQLARGDGVSEDTIRRMASFLARHEGSKDAEGFSAGEDGFPSPGRVAYDAWGGDAGKAWADMLVARFDQDEKQTCPTATGDVAVNLANRQTAIDVADYGPMNPALPNDEYWSHLATYFDVEPDEARSSVCGNCAAFDTTTHMKECIASGITGDGGEPDPHDVVDAGELGYCRIFKFKCASARTCSAWIAGGPITDDEVRGEDQELVKARFLRKEAHKRFTLGPLYVPDFMDAHGEWTDSAELQQGVWEWVKAGDRTIYLQHDRDVRAGEWVEVMTMPQPWTVNMLNGAGESIGKITYPTGTVFLGVIWDEEPWQQILNGELRGYSIGGFSDRVLADLPEEAARDGIELTQGD